VAGNNTTIFVIFRFDCGSERTPGHTPAAFGVSIWWRGRIGCNVAVNDGGSVA
jgi:hypothetical protein